MTVTEEDEMYDNIRCPKCRVEATFFCEDMRRAGNSLGSRHTHPHRERIRLYREWKKSNAPLTREGEEK